jgi:hypothetical protein
MKGGGVVDLSSGPWSAELRVGEWRGKEKRAGSHQKKGAETATQTELAWQGLGKKGWATHKEYFNG